MNVKKLVPAVLLTASPLAAFAEMGAEATAMTTAVAAGTGQYKEFIAANIGYVIGVAVIGSLVLVALRLIKKH